LTDGAISTPKAHLSRATAALGRGRQQHLGAEHAHDLAALDREGLDHDRDERIALGGADHGEGDAGIARGGLDHGLAGLEHTARFRVLDDRNRQAVLDRRAGIEELAFDVDR